MTFLSGAFSRPLLFSPQLLSQKHECWLTCLNQSKETIFIQNSSRSVWSAQRANPELCDRQTRAPSESVLELSPPFNYPRSVGRRRATSNFLQAVSEPHKNLGVGGAVRLVDLNYKLPTRVNNCWAALWKAESPNSTPKKFILCPAFFKDDFKSWVCSFTGKESGVLQVMSIFQSLTFQMLVTGILHVERWVATATFFGTRQKLWEMSNFFQRI